MLYSLLIIVAIAQFFSICNSVSLPEMIAEEGGNRQQYDRAATVGGLMALFPENNDGAVYIFVINEFKGERLVRQSICNRYMANQTELTDGYVREYKNRPNELRDWKIRIMESRDCTNEVRLCAYESRLIIILTRFRAKTYMSCQ